MEMDLKGIRETGYITELQRYGTEEMLFIYTKILVRTRMVYVPKEQSARTAK